MASKKIGVSVPADHWEAITNHDKFRNLGPSEIVQLALAALIEKYDIGIGQMMWIPPDKINAVKGIVER
jgi:hypothetical protein